MVKEVKLGDTETMKMLYDKWAMTWEGLDENDFDTALEMCCEDGKDGEGYLIKGDVMNRTYGLTGTNAYPADLNIFAIPKFKGLAIQYGARWMADIVDNNARREGSRG